MTLFRFVEAERANHAVTTLCRTLGVSSSGYYAWRGRGLCSRAHQNRALTELIASIHRRSRHTYGAPRIHAELRLGHGIRCSQKRVARLMVAAGIVGCHRRRRFNTTRSDQLARKAPDLVRRDFRAAAPNRLWVTDITYLPTKRGHCYLAAVLDVYSRAVVGWSIRNRLGSELATDALGMAILRRRPRPGLVCHSDQGTQYTSVAFGARIERAAMRPSMGRVGSCYDNAMVESFFATLECELICGRPFHDIAEARFAVLDYIEDFYNPRRRHSALDYLSPIDYERAHCNAPLETVH